MLITEPGVYDLTNDEYHADPVKGGSLSASGARKLLPPHCPALFDYERRNPPLPTDEFSFGHAAHKLVLGAGAEIVVVDAKDWKTNAAKEAKAKALADNKIPLLPADFDRAKVMAEAVRRHPLAAALLRQGSGLPERALVWQDKETGIWCRALLDWLPTTGRIAVDLKTCASASPDKIARAVWDYGYFIQAFWYLDGLRALGLAEHPAMAFVFVEKARPHLVNVVQLNHLALEAGAHYARQARLIFAECQAKNEWPGYSDDIELIELPPWAQNQYFQETGK